MRNDETVSVRYMVDDVDDAIAFSTKLLDFELSTNAAPAFADVKRGNLRLLLAGPTSSAGRPMPDGTKLGPGGWNRIHFIVDDLSAEVARRRGAGARFRNDIIEGPGGKQMLLQDPSSNVVELFQPPPATNVTEPSRHQEPPWVSWSRCRGDRAADVWSDSVRARTNRSHSGEDGLVPIR